MKPNGDLKFALALMHQGLLSREQFDELLRLAANDADVSVLTLLRERFGLSPELLADEGTIDEQAAGGFNPQAEAFAQETGASSLSSRPDAPTMPSFNFAGQDSAQTIDSPPSVALYGSQSHERSHFDHTVDLGQISAVNDSSEQATLRDDDPEAGAGDANATAVYLTAKETQPRDKNAKPKAHLRMNPLGQPVQGAGTRERYTLTRLHARGGIGQVWLARDTSLGREVALKELRPEHSPSPNAEARFLEEAKITGQLEHPGIVPVYELKKSPDDDRPFYTMRFIRGSTLEKAIREYHAKRQKGSATALERAALLNAFVSVCNAVHYAHSRGVIHRDLKGQNVVLGDFGEVMVLDWGLAKVMNQPEGATAPGVVIDDPDAIHNPTLQGQVQGTPAYMAPEQAEGRVDDIDIRTDVYGLGAILYEILTGQPPFLGGTTHELLRAVRHDPAPLPQTIDPTVPRALQAICLKSISKKPEDRYSTAGELALDVSRWLADEPVAAYPEPWHQRAGRWIKKHKSGVGAAAGILIMATLGLAVTSVIVKEERDEARRQRQQARAAVDDMYSKVADQWLEDRLDPLQKEFLSKALSYYESFTQQDSNEPGVEQERGRAYLRMGDVLRKLGRHDEAESAYRQAIKVLTDLSQADPAATEPRYYLANAEDRLAESLAERAKYSEAEPLYREALAQIETLEKSKTTPEQQLLAAKTFRGLAELLRVNGKSAESEKAYRDARARLEPLTKEGSLVEARHQLALVDDGLGLLMRESSRPAEAAKSYRESIDVLEKLLAEAPTLPQFRVGLAKVYNSLGLLVRETGNPDESEAILRRQVALDERLTEDFPDRPHYRRTLGRGLMNLAILVKEKGEQKEAEQLYRKALALNEKLTNDFPSVVDYRRDQARCLNNLGDLLYKQAKFAEAEKLCTKAVETYDQLIKQAPTVPSHQYNRAASLMNLAQAQKALQNSDAAAQSYARAGDALVTLATEFPANPDYLRAEAQCRMNLGNLLASLDKKQEAEAAYKQAGETYQRLISNAKALPGDRNAHAIQLTNRAQNLQKLKSPEAEGLYKQSIDLAEKLAEQAPKTAEFRRTLATCSLNFGEFLADARRYKEAEIAYQKASGLYDTLIKEQPGIADYQTELAMTIGDLARLKADQKLWAQAETEWERAVATHRKAIALNPRSTATRRALQEQLRTLATTLADAGNHAKAARTAEELVQAGPETRGIRLEAAKVLARCTSISEKDPSMSPERRALLSAEYADRAISLLRDAIQRGEVKPDTLREDSDFAPLHSRETFKSLSSLVRPRSRV